MAQTIESEVDARKAYHHEWYLAHSTSHRALQARHYRANRAAVIARMRRYRKTAAGMLTDSRHSAKQRGSR